jgi:O-succinylhomoserine sulfhydrylase
MTDTPPWSPETQLVHGGTLRSAFAETSEALFLTQSYVYESAEQAEERFKSEAGGYIYSRYSNPTVAMFEERMRLLEGADAARATATGMAAVTAALLCYLKAGDHIVSARALFGSCRYVVEDLCPRLGIASTIVDGRDTAAWAKAMRPNTRAVFFETPSNPTLELVDIRAVAEIAHAAGALVVVDNVFATPMLQKPLKLGADVVVYSTTKHVDGQGRCLGGIVLGSEDFVKGHLHNFLKHTGPSLSPFNAWVMLKGLETLAVRVRAQCETATRLADHLAERPGGARPAADVGSEPGDLVRAGGGQGGGVPLRQRPAPRQDLQQPRRRQEHRHPPGHHHAPAPGTAGACRSRHLRWHAAPLGGPGGLCGSGRRY